MTKYIPNEDNSTIDQMSLVNEPSQCHPKGCGERLKSRLEKIIPKPRLCRVCRKRGVQHDSQNCPGKQKWYVTQAYIFFIVPITIYHICIYLFVQ